MSLEDALQLVHLYAERGSPKFEPAARRWLVRYLSEGTPTLTDVATVTASLTKHRLRYLSEGTPSLRDVAKVTARLASANSKRAGRN